MTAQLLLEGHAPNRLTADQYLLGRGEGCDILLPEARTMASRRHARLNREASGWYLSNLNSRNGTTLICRQFLAGAFSVPVFLPVHIRSRIDRDRINRMEQPD